MMEGGASELSEEAVLEESREEDVDEGTREGLEVDNSVEARDVEYVSVSSIVWGEYSESVESVSLSMRFCPAR